MSHERNWPSFETPRKRAAPQDDVPAFVQQKRHPPRSAFLSFRERGLLRRRIGGRAARGSVGFELLAGFFRTLLQLFLQLLLGGLELLRIGRRAVIGLGELRERQRQRQRRTVGVDRLND